MSQPTNAPAPAATSRLASGRLPRIDLAAAPGALPLCETPAAAWCAEGLSRALPPSGCAPGLPGVMTAKLRRAHDLREAAKSCRRAGEDLSGPNAANLEPGCIVLQSGQSRPSREGRAFMQFRKLLSDYPGLTTAISIALLLAALGVVGYQLWTRRQPAPQGDPILKEQLHQSGPAQSQAGDASDGPACASATASEVG